MTRVYDDGRCSLYHGSCLDVLPSLPENSVDAVVTDPPYGFDPLQADGTERPLGDWCQSDARRNLEDGDALGADEASRMKQRFANGVQYDLGRRRHDASSWGVCAATGDYAEDKGFVSLPRYLAPPKALLNYQLWCAMWARECLRVLKPGGYLLAFNATRCFHRMTTGLEDAGFEVRDTLHWTHANGFPWGFWPWRGLDKAAGLRVGEKPQSEAGKAWAGCHTGLRPSHELIAVCRKPFAGPVHQNLASHGVGAYAIGPLREEDGGRWPTNTILSHGAECGQGGCQPDCPVAALEIERKGASRYFTVLGPEVCPPVLYSEKAMGKARKAGAGDVPVVHPTVKPEALMARLIRLVTPAGAGATVLDPFAGSGTTGRVALGLGRKAILIERDATYLPLIRARVSNLQLPLVEEVPS